MSIFDDRDVLMSTGVADVKNLKKKICVPVLVGNCHQYFLFLNKHSYVCMHIFRTLPLKVYGHLSAR